MHDVSMVCAEEHEAINTVAVCTRNLYTDKHVDLACHIHHSLLKLCASSAHTS